MYEIGWSGGVAQVVSRLDALRLRYDGAAAIGYQASPYRNVRFGDWQPSIGANQRITFLDTIGSADGLPETVPNERIRHAVVLEWVHSFTDGLALYTQARLGLDSWGIESASGAAELRAATRRLALPPRLSLLYAVGRRLLSAEVPDGVERVHLLHLRQGAEPRARPHRQPRAVARAQAGAATPATRACCSTRRSTCSTTPIPTSCCWRRAPAVSSSSASPGSDRFVVGKGR